jgi:hypothetical protein
MNYFVNAEGLVICSFFKDYEIQLLNKQGEIIQKEGMLTIAFSFIFYNYCIDRRKELYLIIKIPYIISMSLEEKNEVEVEEDESLPIDSKKNEKDLKLKHKISELEKELNQVLENNKKQKEEIEKLKKENLRLRIISGETKSGWKQERDWIERDDPITGEPDGYRCPFVFNRNKIINFEKFFNKEKNELWCKFRHPYLEWPRYEFNMPFTAYLRLKGVLPEQKKKEKKPIPKRDRAIKFKSPESLLQYFKEKLGKKYHSFSFLEIIILFIFENIKKSFNVENVRNYCEEKRGKKPVPATIHKHLNLLINHDIIDRKYHGIYEVNEHSINFH